MSVLERKLGEVRPTQLIYTYGIGQVVDLPLVSGLVMGLDDWPEGYTSPIEEERLLAEVRRVLGPQVEKLVRPPAQPDSEVRGPVSGQPAIVGIPVAPFPRYLRCSYCRTLAPIGSGLFRLITVPGRPDLSRYVHTNCNKATQPRVLPARFLLACEGGHLDDFPWHYFVHGGIRCDGILQLEEAGHTGEAADIRVSCRACSRHKRMALAFGEDGHRHLGSCTARRPHLRDYEEAACTRPPQALLLGASNLWFSTYRRALHVPQSPKTKIAQLVEQHWANLLAPVKNVAVLAYLRDQGKLGAFGTYTDEQIWKAIEARSNPDDGDEPRNLKAPEWDALSMPERVVRTSDFDLEVVTEPPAYKRHIRRVVLVKRLRAVTALIGFSRISEVVQGADPIGARAPLSRLPPRFVPAAEIRGEGIFIEFQEAEIERWLDKVDKVERAFQAAHAAHRRMRNLDPPTAGYPGMRFILLHTFAHALMRQLALECGYAAASITERIYANENPDEGPNMAGVLLYTAAPDSEGTLGGLVRMGDPQRLGKLIAQALADARVCSSDPLCAEHDPDARNLHGAACHACTFAPETSCEAGNRYVDRRTLVGTIASQYGFFDA